MKIKILHLRNLIKIDHSHETPDILILRKSCVDVK